MAGRHAYRRDFAQGFRPHWPHRVNDVRKDGGNVGIVLYRRAFMLQVAAVEG